MYIKKKMVKKINYNSGILIISILAIISIFIIVNAYNYNNIQSNMVYPSGAYPYTTSNVPYEKIKEYQFCHQYECVTNCENPFPDRKCVYYAKGTTANCPIFTDKIGSTWQPHWKCE